MIKIICEICAITPAVFHKPAAALPLHVCLAVTSTVWRGAVAHTPAEVTLTRPTQDTWQWMSRFHWKRLTGELRGGVLSLSLSLSLFKLSRQGQENVIVSLMTASVSARSHIADGQLLQQQLRKQPVVLLKDTTRMRVTCLRPPHRFKWHSWKQQVWFLLCRRVFDHLHNRQSRL